MPPPKVYTPDEARRILRIGRSRCYELLHQGKLKSIRNGNRFLIPEECLIDFVQANTKSQSREGVNRL